MTWILTCAALLIALRLAAQLVLDALNRAEVRRNQGKCPSAVALVMDEATYGKSVQYTLAKSRFSSFECALDAILLGAVLFSGLLPLLWARIDGVAPGASWSGALFVVATLVLLGALNLPLEWWSRFRLEARFGFNTSTLGLWAVDQVKYLALGIAIGFPLVWVLLWIVAHAGVHWWIWGFALMFSFQVLMMVLYPKLILPLFNKLSPLQAGAQREGLMALAERTGFRAQTIEVMDGSKRSAHSNAFFTGFGRFRRIVFFDTLMAQLAPDELEAVLAHEIGHYKCGHVPKGIALSAAFQLASFAIVAFLADSPWFNTAFGLPAGALAPTFLILALTGGLVTFWFSPTMYWLSRRHEYEADAFAKRAMGSSDPLIGALRKLSQKNLSNLTPHPLYSLVYYSHPTLVEREAALRV